MKRGQQLDRVLASEICCLFCLQVGDEDSTKLFNALKPTLLSLISDDTISSIERAAVSVIVSEIFCIYFYLKRMKKRKLSLKEYHVQGVRKKFPLLIFYLINELTCVIYEKTKKCE